MLLFRTMLVAGYTVGFLALDLLFIIQMRPVDVFHLIGKLDFLCFEFVIRFSVAVGRHATGSFDPRSGLNRLTAKRNVSESIRAVLGYVFDTGRGAWSGALGRILAGRRWIMALDAARLVVFAILPCIVTLLKNTWIGQNMTIAAKQLGLRYFRRWKLDGRP